MGQQVQEFKQLVKRSSGIEVILDLRGLQPHRRGKPHGSDLIHQEPVVSQVKLIAEPWTIGEGGYQAGTSLPNWSEWNGKYRACVHDYWRGVNHTMSEFAYRLAGSSDLYATSGRKPFVSINFITAHDGFTLRDLAPTSRNGEQPRPIT